jgi:uncharacterized protein (UPF0335 family)
MESQGGQAVNHYYTLMSCNGLEWIQPPSNESRLPGCYAYYDPPARIVDELNRLVERIKRLEDWKDSAMAVEREWDANAISTMLGGQLGESQRVVIMREVPRLLERIKRLEEVGDNLSDCADQIGWTSCESPQWIKKAENAVKEWRKAKEDKP